ncbi:MAG: PIG-L family deacetylase [bacterium]|nr:PIG-L family deacetylase [bacterium]
MEEQRRILSIGAHPDDADTYSGGLLSKLREAGWQVRLLSVTDGSAGTYHMDESAEELKLKRRSEAAASGRLLDARYDVLDYPDGRLEVTLAAREHLIRYIRRYRPDVILTNRPNDYHADHRNVSLLVQDASFLLTVPHICADTPYLAHTPAILFWADDFKKPYPHSADIIVPVSRERVDFKVQLASCHACQYFDWMYWPDHMERIAWPREKQVALLAERYHGLGRAQCGKHREKLAEKYGAEAEKIYSVELYEISEYGEAPSEEFLRIAESVE